MIDTSPNEPLRGTVSASAKRSDSLQEAVKHQRLRASGSWDIQATASFHGGWARAGGILGGATHNTIGCPQETHTDTHDPCDT